MKRARKCHRNGPRHGLRFWILTVTAVVASALATSTAQTTPVATVALTTGWATFGQALPRGAAANGLQIGTLATQTDVKSRWADGSIKFAVLTALVPSSGSYAVTPAALSTGGFTPSMPRASVTFVIGGVTYTATLPSTMSTDRWLSGPLVTEGRFVVAPMSGSGSAHPFLRVIFDTRVYKDAQARVDVTVENVLDQIGATTVTYDVSVALNGQNVFGKSGVQHYYLTRWRKVFATGGTALAAVRDDLAPVNRSKALPPYLSLVTNVVNSATGSNYDILGPGALNTNMPDHGGRPELAPYPDWTARYLVHRDPTQRAFVLIHGDLAGSWPVHVRESETGAHSGVGAERFVSLDERPNIWYDERAQSAGYDYVKGTPMPIREYTTLTPGPGQSPLIPDNAHQPSLAYVPYLLTGDRYYAEEMAFWANYSMLRTYPGDGVRGSQGILENNEVRGFGWTLRNIVDAAAFFPDGSPVKTYLSQKVSANLQWLDNYANVQKTPSNPFWVLWLNHRPEGPRYISLWEETYLAHAIDRAIKQGFASASTHRDAIAQFQLRLFTSEPDYPRLQAAPYLVGVGDQTASGYVFYTTMAQIWSATQGQERTFAGYYGPEARLNLMIGVESGWSGAQAAYDYLWPYIGQGNPADLAQRAGWAVDFYDSKPVLAPVAPSNLRIVP
jgi:hypothetical protein